MASHYMCIMNYACYKDDLQDAKHMVTYIICFTFATRTPLDIRSAYSTVCGLGAGCPGWLKLLKARSDVRAVCGEAVSSRRSH